jgi:hypothetical protein
VFGFEHRDMFIYDPFLSDCGRFTADPAEAYGISEPEAKALVTLNQVLSEAIKASLNAGCLTIQTAMAIPAGDVAGMYFSDALNARGIAESLAGYLDMELANASAGVDDQERPSVGKNGERLMYLKDDRVLAVGDSCAILYRNYGDYLAERRQDECSVLVYDE